MNRYQYSLDLTPDDNGTFLVTCADLPEVTSFGETERDAIDNGNRAVEEAIAARLAHFEPIPEPAQNEPAQKTSRAFATIPLRLQPKIALMDVMVMKRLNRADLVRATGWSRTSVDRLFDPHHNNRLDQFEEAFKAVGAAPAFVADKIAAPSR